MYINCVWEKSNSDWVIALHKHCVQSTGVTSCFPWPPTSILPSLTSGFVASCTDSKVQCKFEDQHLLFLYGTLQRSVINIDFYSSGNLVHCQYYSSICKITSGCFISLSLGVADIPRLTCQACPLALYFTAPTFFCPTYFIFLPFPCFHSLFDQITVYSLSS